MTRPARQDRQGGDRRPAPRGGPTDDVHGSPRADRTGPADRKALLAEHHHKTLWASWVLVLLGFWTVLAPVSFGYETGWVTPADGREVWLPAATRVAILTASDVACGVLLILCGLRALTPNRPVARWLACFVGIWMNVAPLVFWAPVVACYVNDTLVGVLAIALSVLVPGVPGILRFKQFRDERTPGWSYNPSSWSQRLPLIALAFAGWMVARYLAMFQLGYIHAVWEPFFGTGSREVLTSTVSDALPVSDVGVGALAYTLQFLLGWVGGTSRWRTMPWMVALFGLMVIPVGVTHVLLVASQPIVVGHWCTLCLVAAGIMLVMVPLEIDEVVSTGQFLRLARQEGKSLWRTFWKGGLLDRARPESPQTSIDRFAESPLAVFRAALRGVSVPWTLAVTAGLGVWLIVSPAVLGTTRPLADVAFGGGALAVVVSVMAMAEVVRIGRYLNTLLGVALIACTWLGPGASWGGVLVNTAVGGLLVVLSLPRGPKRETYGSWDRLIR